MGSVQSWMGPGPADGRYNGSSPAAGVRTIVRMVRAALLVGDGGAVDVYQLAYHAGVAFEVLAEILAIPLFYHRFVPRLTYRGGPHPCYCCPRPASCHLRADCRQPHV